WPQLRADPSPRIDPLPSTSMKKGVIGTLKASQASEDITTGTPRGASSRTLEGDSFSGPLVTMTGRVVSVGIAGLSPSSDQKSRHAEQPDERNAIRVSPFPWTRLTRRACPDVSRPSIALSGTSPSPVTATPRGDDGDPTSPPS